MTIETKLVLDRHASDQVKRKLAQLRDAISTSGGGGSGGMRNANHSIAQEMLGWVDRNLKTEGGKVGGWVPYTYGGRLVRKGYLGRKRKGEGAVRVNLLPSKRAAWINTNAKLMNDEGDLSKSFKYFYSQRSAGVGSDIKHAAAHEFGIPSRNVPKRRLLPTDKDSGLTRKLVKIYDFYIAKALRKRVN